MKDELIDEARFFCNQKQTNKQLHNNGKTPADVSTVLRDEWIDDATFLLQKNNNKIKNDNDKNKDDDDDYDRRSNKY
jgi:hypothetical protein